MLHSLSLLVLGQADRLMIGHMVGKSQAAFYGIAYIQGTAHEGYIHNVFCFLKICFNAGENRIKKYKVAFYGIAYNLASAIAIFQSSLEVVMVPWRYRKLEGGYYDKHILHPLSDPPTALQDKLPEHFPH